jgi:2-dehydro-3-deoxy-D-arabinonate dehydratase
MPQLVKLASHPSGLTVGLNEGGLVRPLSISPGQQYESLSDVFEDEDPEATVQLLVDRLAKPIEASKLSLVAPIDRQEVWAAGVTYRRSRTARMEESQGAARFYDLVYEAPRPELFLKATPHRVVGHEQAVRIRNDAHWNVPEPELALVLNSRLKLVGFTIGNDMSSRDIEGENPLYLPQAKVYNECCALGPGITLVNWIRSPEQAAIRLLVRRGDRVAFEGETNVSQMARSFQDLVDWLARDNSFPHGVILLTGTGIVPTEDFTLEAGDEVVIAIEGLGTLVNPVVRR